MSIKGTLLKFGSVAAVLLVFTGLLVVVFGQVRFDRTYDYSAEFASVSGLRPGQFVRASGVEVGKVKSVDLVDGGQRARVRFTVDRSLPLYQSTVAQIRYFNLIGDRYLELERGTGEGSTVVLPAGSVIPASRTQAALDLDALIGGFKPLFRALDPEKVSTIANAITTVFQGQGGSISDILEHTAQLTAALADRDEAIGRVVSNLNVVLDTAVAHRKEFDTTIVQAEQLVRGLSEQADPLADSVARISNAAGTVADLLAENRPLLEKTVSRLDPITETLIDKLDEVDEIVQLIPPTQRLLGRAGSYGDFFNFYTCDVTILANGLQPGGGMRKARLFQQPTGRCTPQ